MEKLSIKERFALVFLMATIMFVIAGTVLGAINHSWSIFGVMGVGVPSIFYSLFFWALGINPIKKIQERLKKKN